MSDTQHHFRSKDGHEGDAGRLHTLFSALGDARRLFMFRLLLVEREACVSEVARRCGISIPAASQQLRVLERAGLAVRERKGRRICYYVNKTHQPTSMLMRLVAH